MAQFVIKSGDARLGYVDSSLQVTIPPTKYLDGQDITTPIYTYKWVYSASGNKYLLALQSNKDNPDIDVVVDESINSSDNIS